MSLRKIPENRERISRLPTGRAVANQFWTPNQEREINLMASFNSITLMGNITRDIELRSMPSGSAVCDIGLATNRKFYNKSTESQQEEVCFIDCTAFGKTAETIHKYLRKGSQILIQGRLTLDTWQYKDTGANRSKHKVIIETMTMLGGKSEVGSQADSFYDSPGAGSQDTPDKDVPF